MRQSLQVIFTGLGTALCSLGPRQWPGKKSVVSEFNLEMVTVSIIIYAAIQVSSSCQGALFQQLQCDRPSLPWALNKCGLGRMGHSITKTSLQIYSKFLRKTMNGPIRWSDGLISKYLYLIWTLLILSHREVFGNKNGLMNARQATVDPANGFLSKVKAQATKCCADQTRVPASTLNVLSWDSCFSLTCAKLAPTDWEDMPMGELSGSNGEGSNGWAYSLPPHHGHGLDDDNNNDTAAYSLLPCHGHGLDDGNNNDTEAILQQSQKWGIDHAKDDDEPLVSPVHQFWRQGNKDNQNNKDQDLGIRNTSAQKKSTWQCKGAPCYW